MNIFISGGSKNGKSYLAQKIAVRQFGVINETSQSKKHLFYIATLPPTDSFSIEKIKKHQEEREHLNFETIECFNSLDKILQVVGPDDSIVFDSLSSFLKNNMFDEDGYRIAFNERILEKQLQLLTTQCKNVVIVSDYIYADINTHDDLTRFFIKNLALLDSYCTNVCDIVMEGTAGEFIFHKGYDTVKKNSYIFKNIQK